MGNWVEGWMEIVQMTQNVVVSHSYYRAYTQQLHLHELPRVLEYLVHLLDLEHDELSFPTHYSWQAPSYNPGGTGFPGGTTLRYPNDKILNIATASKEGQWRQR